MKTNQSAPRADVAGAASPLPDAILSAAPQPVIRPRGEHGVSRRDIDPDALRVLYRLARNNFTAYLVGGGVRDLLLGRKPKDFDISTNARPEQIRSLFRNCILIGRRFRLAHIRYGEKIIETSTFRGSPAAAGDPADPEADLFQRDDNLFGTPQEDALRRDFTVNGLFYDIATFSIIDYAGGLDDLAAKRIRCIGDPGIRFREDPVRMVRAVRFASRLGFSLEAETEEAIRKHATELAKAAPARLLEEITRLFAFSSGEKAVRLLHSTGLLAVLLPEVASALAAEGVDHALFWRRLAALDNGDTVLPEATPALIFATLLFDALQLSLGKKWGMREAPKLKFERVHRFLEPLAARLRFPRRMVDRIVHMYLTLARLHEQGASGKRGAISNLVTHEAFHEGLALAEIVVTAEGGSQADLALWRDMLAERLFGGEAGTERPGGQVQGQTHGGLPSTRDPNRNANREGEGGERLSRSARRRRNKRRRKIDGAGNGEGSGRSGATGAAGAAVTPLAPVVPATVPGRTGKDRNGETPALPAALPAPGAQNAPLPSPPDGEKSGRARGRRRRGGEGRKDGGATDKAAAERPGAERAGAAKSAGAEEAVVPLTAAAFYTPPPPPEPEPEPEEKPKRGRRGRGGAAKSNEPAPQPGAETPPERAKRPAPDKADEADTPLHWLDEI